MGYIRNKKGGRNPLKYKKQNSYSFIQTNIGGLNWNCQLGCLDKVLVVAYTRRDKILNGLLNKFHR